MALPRNWLRPPPGGVYRTALSQRAAASTRWPTPRPWLGPRPGAVSRIWQSRTTTGSTPPSGFGDTAPPELTIIVGEEVKTADGDLIAVFLREAVRPACRPSRRSPRSESRAAWWASRIHSTSARVRSKERRRLESIAHLVDWVEAYNARVVGGSATRRRRCSPASTGCRGSAHPTRTPSWRSASPTTS